MNSTLIREMCVMGRALIYWQPWQPDAKKQKINACSSRRHVVDMYNVVTS